MLTAPSVRESIAKQAYHVKEDQTEDAIRCGNLHLSRAEWAEDSLEWLMSGAYGNLAPHVAELAAGEVAVGRVVHAHGGGPRAARRTQATAPRAGAVWLRGRQQRTHSWEVVQGGGVEEKGLLPGKGRRHDCEGRVHGSRGGRTPSLFRRHSQSGQRQQSITPLNCQLRLRLVSQEERISQFNYLLKKRSSRWPLEQLCCVCMDRPKMVMFEPCCHVSVCKQCAPRIARWRSARSAKHAARRWSCTSKCGASVGA